MSNKINNETKEPTYQIHKSSPDRGLEEEKLTISQLKNLLSNLPLKSIHSIKIYIDDISEAINIQRMD